MHIGALSPKIGTAIVEASRELIEGKFHDQFDVIQGGTGTSMNMKPNEAHAMAVYVIVSFLKDPLKMLVKRLNGNDECDWIVRPISVLVALGILVWLMLVQGTVTTETIGLAIINAFLVALIAGAAHDYIVAYKSQECIAV